MQNNILRNSILGCINAYQRHISPLLGPRCRFYPTCSRYTRECIETLPLHRALPKSLWRILRCQPLCPGGYDPVQEQSIDHSA